MTNGVFTQLVQKFHPVDQNTVNSSGNDSLLDSEDNYFQNWGEGGARHHALNHLNQTFCNIIATMLVPSIIKIYKNFIMVKQNLKWDKCNFATTCPVC